MNDVNNEVTEANDRLTRSQSVEETPARPEEAAGDDTHSRRERIRRTLGEMEEGLDELMEGVLEAGDDLRSDLAAGLYRFGKKLEAAAIRLGPPP